MFVKNLWYCAGWDYELSQSRNALLARRIAGEPLVLYRQRNGSVVALADRCCHRQAPLSLGLRQGDSLRCGYHGMLFGPDGVCSEIPGQSVIPPKARVRAFPVVEKDNWIWVWMGDPAQADAALICHAVGPGEADWNIRTSKVAVNANYRLEIANLTDLSHITWVHRQTLGGTMAWVEARPTVTELRCGINSEFWLPASPPPSFAAHLFPPDTVFDAHASIDFTLPCNFVLHYQVWTPGTMQAGKEHGQLLLDSWTSQAVTPRDADWCDYYYSWGLSRATDTPGMSEMLLDAVNAAFIEDRTMLEAQYQRLRERPDGNLVDIRNDAGPNRMLFMLDRLLGEEARGGSAVPASGTAGG